MAASPEGCGVLAHKDTCLCDVKPLGVTIAVDDGVHGMWMGREICEQRGHAAPWVRETIAEYFTDLVHLYDEWTRRKFVVELPDGLPPCYAKKDWGNQHFQKWQAIRVTVKAAMEKYAAPLSDILQYFGLSPTEFLEACTSNRHHNIRISEYGELDELEALLMLRDPLHKQCLQRFGIQKSQWYGLRKFYKVRHARLWGASKAEEQARYEKASAMIRVLCEDMTLGNAEIVRRVNDATGRLFDVSYVTRIRKQKGLQ